jgi:hypothetical protein
MMQPKPKKSPVKSKSDQVTTSNSQPKPAVQEPSPASTPAPVSIANNFLLYCIYSFSFQFKQM